MKHIVTVCLVALLLVPLGCGRRVSVQKPDGGRIIVNDRVVDIISDRALSEAIAKVPAAEQAGLVKELIASKERLAVQQMNVEDKRQVNFWGVVIESLKFVLPAVTGYYLAR